MKHSDTIARVRRMTGRDTEALSEREQQECYSRALAKISPNDANEITADLTTLQSIPDVGPVGALDLVARVALLVAQKWGEWCGGENARENA